VRAVLGGLSRGFALFFGVGTVGLAGAIALVASEQPGRAGSASQPAERPHIQERMQARAQVGPSSIVVMVRSEEQAVRIGREVGDISGYHDGVPASFLVVESDREAEIVRVLLKNDRDRLLIEFWDDRPSAR
jgi:hypothetical protein